MGFKGQCLGQIGPYVLKIAKKKMELLAFPYFAWGIQSKGWISGCKCLCYKVIPAINTVFEGD